MEYNTNVSRRFQYDGAEVSTELAGTAITGRYVRGDGADEVLVWYNGSGTSDRRWLHADERGSIVAVSDGAGSVSINRYDEYGMPGSTNTGLFQYTGQMWLPELGLYNYKARMYDPTLSGRFMQTDPIGYGDGMNMYAYVRNDPTNAAASWRSVAAGRPSTTTGFTVVPHFAMAFQQSEPQEESACSNALITRRTPT